MGSRRITIILVFISLCMILLWGCGPGLATKIGAGSSKYMIEEGDTGYQPTSDPFGEPARDWTPASKKNKEMEVLLIPYEQATQLSYEVAQQAFPSSQIILKNENTIEFIHFSFLSGDVLLQITPKLVQNNENEDEHGIVFSIVARGYGSTYSSSPGYAADIFFKKLATYRDEMALKTAIFKNFQILSDKGIVENISASVPTTIEGFKKYIDDKSSRSDFEGIWTVGEGKYTIGIVQTKKDATYQFKAFILQSKVPSWKPGEIKAKFMLLKSGKMSPGTYYLESKMQENVIWMVENDLIRRMDAANSVQASFIKIYPDSRFGYDDSFSTVGTGWAITSDGVFITNAHVIEGAENIFVGFREENPMKARVLISDRRIDLAVIKVISPSKSFKPLTVKESPLNSGEEITVIGYPLAFSLGDDPRITEGVISAQSGHNKDVTRYQISADINPGSSGAPLFDSAGNVAGIVVEKYDNASGVNFAIKSGYINSLLTQVGISPSVPLHETSMNKTEIFEKFKGSIYPVWSE